MNSPATDAARFDGWRDVGAQDATDAAQLRDARTLDDGWPDVGSPGEGGSPDIAVSQRDANLEAGGEASIDASLDAAGVIPADASHDSGAPLRGVFEYSAPQRTLVLTALAPGILRVHYLSASTAQHERGWTTLPQSWPEEPLPFTDQGVSWRVRTGDFDVVVQKNDATLVVTDRSGHTLVEDLPLASSGDGHTLRQRLPDDAHLFGLGEKTGRLDKRGQRLTMWASDPWYPEPNYTPSSDPLYQSHPFYLQLRGGIAHGVYLNNTFRSVFDLGATSSGELVVSVDGGDLDYFLISGPRVSDVVERFTQLVGRSAMPPLWALGYHQCRWSYAPADEVRRIVAEFRARALPLDGIWLDIDYMHGFRSFTWDPVGFPDPAQLLAELEAQGVKATVIVDPGIKQQASGYAVYDTGVSGQHFVTLPSGELYVGTVWPGAAVFPDFTRPTTRAWWASWVATLVQSGARGVWIDMNEPTTWQPGGFPLDARFDGEGVATDHREARNVYALLMAQATRAGMQTAAPDLRPFVLTRSGFSGIQRHAAVWTGDARSEWSHLAMAPAMLMNLGLSGVAFVGSDVGGFSGNPGAELFARWLQFGMLSPFFRAHVMQGAPRQEPWSFGREVEEIARHYLGLRYELLPYLYSLMHAASVTGAPLLRPLLYEFQADATTYASDDELMLGPVLLAAPVLQAGQTTRTIQVPAGTWLDFYNAQLVVGPTVATVHAPIERLPLLVRGNGILPMWPAQQFVQETSPDPLYLDLYPAAGVAPVAFELYLDAGDGFAYESGAYYAVSLGLTATATSATLTLGAERGTFTPSHQHIWLRFHGLAAAPDAVERAGVPVPRAADLQALRSGDGWYFEASAQVLHVGLGRSPAGAQVTATYSVMARTPRTVRMELIVELPPSTPVGAAVYLASDLDGWSSNGRLLTRVGDHEARAILDMLEGERIAYKFTRGTWADVEKSAGCGELGNRERVALGERDGTQRVVDTVARWADLDCP